MMNNNSATRKEKVFLTTSTGLYYLSLSTLKVSEELTGGCSSDQPSLGFFGITYAGDRDSVIVASRERGHKKFSTKKSSASQLYRIYGDEGKCIPLETVEGVEDVHQIAYQNEKIYLSDTGRNRVWVYNLADKSFRPNYKVGWRRKDVNHINALGFYDGHLLIGMNNRGRRFSQIGRLQNPESDQGNKFFPAKLDLFDLPGILHSHDLQVFGSIAYVCDSSAGRVFRVDLSEKKLIPVEVLKYAGWVRGVAVVGNNLWVGVSEKGRREERYNPSRAQVIRASVTDGKILDVIDLGMLGQVNDLLYWA